MKLCIVTPTQARAVEAPNAALILRPPHPFQDKFRFNNVEIHKETVFSELKRRGRNC